MLDGGNGASTPTVLETFELYGAYIENVNYNTLAYNTSEPATITLTVRYDNAVQTPQGTGLGTAVARTIGTLSTGGGQ
jgi:shikimate kinase